MANTPQAKKRIRRNTNRADHQSARDQPNPDLREAGRIGARGRQEDGSGRALKMAQPELARGVARGVIHKNTASRKLSRLSKRVAALG